MLKITIPDSEYYDSTTETFINVKGCTLELEHSLVSLSKWESKWCKPFISTNKSHEETIDYVRCMTLTPHVDPNVYMNLSNDNIIAINEYIKSPMTATWFSNENKRGGNNETITSELIYYWMIALNIPFECQKWHLNRLLTLVKVCNIKNQPPKKMSRNAILKQNAALNNARRLKHNTKG